MRCAFLILVTSLLPMMATELTVKDLPSLADLKMSQWNSGNPLARYVATLDLEKVYESESRSQDFWQNFANLAPFLGDVEGAMKARTIVWPSQPLIDESLLKSSLHGYRPVSAVNYILDEAKTSNVIMVGEEHMDSQTRCLLLPLLRGLKSRGYEYFAAETFCSDLAETNRSGYTVRSTGFYTQDPIFAQAVNEAIKLGYRLQPYECIDEPAEIKAADHITRQNYREFTQAKNLKERIFDKDPKAKVLVWGGRGHVYKELTDKTIDSTQQWQPMAYRFKQITGIDPFCVFLPSQTELGSREKETSEFKFAAQKGWLKNPSVLVATAGDGYFGKWGCIEVFFPRQKFRRGRVDWLARDLGRVAVKIPATCISEHRLQLAQAYGINQIENAVPIDRVLIRPGLPVPVLMLPKQGQFVIRVIDASGKMNNEAVVRT